ncbi:MAG: DUF2442 domain-containing protein [Cytophagales bacterium]|nr:DUF2442 domain-containing protein [Cytophagales bacterium]
MSMIDVTAAHALPQRRIDLTFADGVRAVLEMDRIIERYQGVFAPLLDSQYFNKLQVNPDIGTIAWPNGADICPDVLYSFAIKQGQPYLAA